VRPRRRWEENNEMNLKEVGRGGVDCNELFQDRVQCRVLPNTVMKLRIP
jgi:hypothetical protein